VAALEAEAKRLHEDAEREKAEAEQANQELEVAEQAVQDATTAEDVPPEPVPNGAHGISGDEFPDHEFQDKEEQQEQEATTKEAEEIAAEATTAEAEAPKVTEAQINADLSKPETARCIAIFHAMDEDGGGSVDIDELSMAFSVLERADVEVTKSRRPCPAAAAVPCRLNPLLVSRWSLMCWTTMPTGR